MGTSKSLPTPSGGAWSPVKHDITAFLGGGKPIAPKLIVAGTIAAAQSLLGTFRPAAATSGGARSGGGNHSTSGGSRATARRARRAAVGKALAGLSGFAAAVQGGGLDRGLRALGLDDLHGRPAAEVIAAIADHLGEGTPGLSNDLLKNALRNSIFEAAELVGDPTYENLEAALQRFLAEDGIEGLAELFLANLTFDQVWALIENHADLKSDTTPKAKALAEAIQHCCRSEARALFAELKADDQLRSTDWFGRDGRRYAGAIAQRLEERLVGMGA